MHFLGDVLTIEIHTKSDIAIGQWDLAVRSYRNGRRGPIIKVADDIIVIFNPWHKSRYFTAKMVSCYIFPFYKRFFLSSSLPSFQLSVLG